MRFFLTIFLFLAISHCTKPRTVLICGDHVCINKAEAEQYFEENLSIEVKVISKKKKKEIDLVELNLKEDVKGERKVSISSKKNINKELRTLSKKDVLEIKENIKNKNRNKKIDNKNIEKKLKVRSTNNNSKKKDKVLDKKKVYKKSNENIDICTILEKCSIDEISKYLLKKGRKDSFPDITIRQ